MAEVDAKKKSFWCTHMNISEFMNAQDTVNKLKDDQDTLTDRLKDAQDTLTRVKMKSGPCLANNGHGKFYHNGQNGCRNLVPENDDHHRSVLAVDESFNAMPVKDSHTGEDIPGRFWYWEEPQSDICDPVHVSTTAKNFPFDDKPTLALGGQYL